MKSLKKHINNNSNNLPWIDLFEIFQSEKYLERVEAIPENTLRFAADPDNRTFLILSAKRSLEATQGQNVSQSQAEILADLMSVLARIILQNKEVVIK